MERRFDVCASSMNITEDYVAWRGRRSEASLLWVGCTTLLGVSFRSAGEQPFCDDSTSSFVRPSVRENLRCPFVFSACTARPGPFRAGRKDTRTPATTEVFPLYSAFQNDDGDGFLAQPDLGWQKLRDEQRKTIERDVLRWDDILLSSRVFYSKETSAWSRWLHATRGVQSDSETLEGNW